MADTRIFSSLSAPSAPPARLFARRERPLSQYPTQHVDIDWGRLVTKRPLGLDIIKAIPSYLLKPEVLALLDAEKALTYRLTSRCDVDYWRACRKCWR